MAFIVINWYLGTCLAVSPCCWLHLECSSSALLILLFTLHSWNLCWSLKPLKWVIGPHQNAKPENKRALRQSSGNSSILNSVKETENRKNIQNACFLLGLSTLMTISEGSCFGHSFSYRKPSKNKAKWNVPKLRGGGIQSLWYNLGFSKELTLTTNVRPPKHMDELQFRLWWYALSLFYLKTKVQTNVIFLGLIKVIVPSDFIFENLFVSK